MMWKDLPTPCYVADEKKLKENLRILQKLEKDTGCHVLLAQKAFSMFSLYPMIGTFISGTTASGLYEARLGREEMGKENHVFAPAYKEADMKELVKICDHIVFNSFRQYEKYKELCKQSAQIREDGKPVSVGIRVNPECSTQEGHEIYDPCGPGSRLGVTKAEFREDLLLLRVSHHTLQMHVSGYVPVHNLTSDQDLLRSVHVFSGFFQSIC